MAKEEPIHFDGTVTTALPDNNFRVAVSDEHNVLCHLAGQMVRNGVSVMEGDEVRLEVTPYDLTRGRIVERLS